MNTVVEMAVVLGWKSMLEAMWSKRNGVGGCLKNMIGGCGWVFADMMLLFWIEPLTHSNSNWYTRIQKIEALTSYCCKFHSRQCYKGDFRYSCLGWGGGRERARFFSITRERKNKWAPLRVNLVFLLAYLRRTTINHKKESNETSFKSTSNDQLIFFFFWGGRCWIWLYIGWENERASLFIEVWGAIT